MILTINRLFYYRLAAIFKFFHVDRRLLKKDKDPPIDHLNEFKEHIFCGDFRFLNFTKTSINRRRRLFRGSFSHFPQNEIRLVVDIDGEPLQSASRGEAVKWIFL